MAVCPSLAFSVQGLTIRSSRDRFAAAELYGKLSQRRGRKAVRLNSGVRCRMQHHRDVPFDSLPMESGEVIRWQAWEPSFHRFSFYAIVVSDRAVYLYSKLITSFAVWRRVPLADIQAVEFFPSWFMPKLVLTHRTGKFVLRTPPDFGAAARIDRRQLQDAAGVIQESLGGT